MTTFALAPRSLDEEASPPRLGGYGTPQWVGGRKG
jgi:hypothetical protein